MCPKLNVIKITFFCKVLAYEIESPSTPTNLNTTMTTGSDLFAYFTPIPSSGIQSCFIAPLI